MTQKMVSFPIRLILGYGNQVSEGMSILYEKPDGTAGWKRINFGGRLSGIHFIDEGESRIEFELVQETVRVPVGFFKEKDEIQEVLDFVGVYIRRDCMKNGF